ncbi:13029_t:CDS:2, partial [Entrophospora sp. SA101]
EINDLKSLARLWRWSNISSTDDSTTGPFGQAFHSSSKNKHPCFSASRTPEIRVILFGIVRPAL